MQLLARSQNAQHAANSDVFESREAIVLKTAFTCLHNKRTIPVQI
jgi:hypothetical protein